MTSDSLSENDFIKSINDLLADRGSRPPDVIVKIDGVTKTVSMSEYQILIGKVFHGKLGIDNNGFFGIPIFETIKEDEDGK